MTADTRPEPHVGQVLAPRQLTITPELLQVYCGGLAVERRSAVPLMLANAADSGNLLLFSQQRGHLWLRQEWEFFAPLVEGVTYTVDGGVADIYPRRERTILLTETVLRDPGGGLVSRQRHHQSFLLDRPEGAAVELRDPATKEGARSFSVPAGRVLGELERTVSLEMCGEFFHGSRNYHSDRAASEELGFKDVVVGGRMTMGYVGEVLEAALGEPWTRSGRLLVKFTNVLWPGERIIVRARETGPTAGEPGRTGVLAWIEKADGTVVLVAEGSLAA